MRSCSASIGLELAPLGANAAAASDANGADADANVHITVRIWDESPSVSRATAAEHASACPVAAAPASHTDLPALCDFALGAAVSSAPASPSNVAAATHASSVRIWLGGHDEGSGPPLPPPPAPNLLNLPSDCAFSILLLLDGTSLASLSATCSALLDLTRGADAAFLWRQVARADVTRLRLHERLGFAEPMWSAAAAAEGELEDEWVENGSRSPAPASDAPTTSSARGGVLPPRAQYLLRLKQRAQARASRALEAARQGDLVRVIRDRDALFVRRQVAIESAFMALLPGALLASSLLLQASDSEASLAWAVWVPIWAGLCGAIGMGPVMQRLRSDFLRRKRREREDARGAPPNVVVVAGSAAAGAGAASANQPVGAALPVAAASGANVAASSGPAAAAAAAAATAARARSDAALERERLNTRFLSSRQAGGFPTRALGGSFSSSSSSSSSATDGGAEGLLAALLDHYFSHPSHARVNLLRVGALLAWGGMLCARTAASVPVAYAAVFAPVFLLGLHALLVPFLPARWCAPSFASSSSSAAWVRSRAGGGAGAGGGVSPGARCRLVLEHLASFLAWWACPLLFLALLAVHLDRSPGQVSLLHAMLPLWLWQGCGAAALAALVLRFGAGVVLRRRRADSQQQPQQQQQQHGPAAAAQLHARGARSFSPSRWCCPFGGVFVSRDPSQLNGRMACTVAAVLAALLGLVVFEALLCVRSAQLRSDPDPGMGPGGPDPPRLISRPLHSAWVCLPLSLSLLVWLVLAVISATQMRRQRLAAFAPSASASGPAPAPPISGPVSSPPLSPSVRGQGVRDDGLAASPTVTSASAPGSRRALSA